MFDVRKINSLLLSKYFFDVSSFKSRHLFHICTGSRLDCCLVFKPWPHHLLTRVDKKRMSPGITSALVEAYF